VAISTDVRIELPTISIRLTGIKTSFGDGSSGGLVEGDDGEGARIGLVGLAGNFGSRDSGGRVNGEDMEGT
jgi:hypothetical protein